MKVIQLTLITITALLGVISLVAGIITGLKHLYMIAIVALVLAYAGSDEPIKNKNNGNK